MTVQSSASRRRKYFYNVSRSRGFLWRFALGMLLAGTVAGYGLSCWRPARPEDLGERVLAMAGIIASEAEDAAKIVPDEGTSKTITEHLCSELRRSGVGFDDVLWAIPVISSHLVRSDHEVIGVAFQERYSAEQAELLTAYLASWHAADTIAYERLRALASRRPPQRYARHALGLIEMKRENYSGAFEQFRAEGELDEADESRYMAMRALIEGKDLARLADVRRDPAYAVLFSPSMALEAAIAAKDWPGIVRWVPAVQLRSFQRDVLVVAIISGLAWAFFLGHLGEVGRMWSARALLCGLGFVAGVASTTPTVWLSIWQDEIMGLSAGGDLLHALVYCVGGVGVREELCKLLLFVPLLPWLMKRGDELEVLIVASFVGLGFAIEENGNYYMMSAAASAPGRFLTANFFHVALTGLNGLALFRACTRGMGGVNELLAVLPLTIVAHGAYDAFLELPSVEDAGFFAMIVYVGTVMFYFNRVNPLRSNHHMTISLTGAFVVGVSVLAAASIVFQMATLGPAAGATLIFSELIGSAVLLLVFFHQFNEPLTD